MLQTGSQRDPVILVTVISKILGENFVDIRSDRSAHRVEIALNGKNSPDIVSRISHAVLAYQRLAKFAGISGAFAEKYQISCCSMANRALQFV
jgi:hypothetical protein